MNSIDEAQAIAHLVAGDPVMGRIIAGCGPFELRPDSSNPFASLARSIIFQQLSGKAAGTIFGRFVALFDAPGTNASLARPDWDPMRQPFPEPALVLRMEQDTLRSAGLSRQKVAAVRSLAEHFASGELGSEQFDSWTDEEIIVHLTRVRGVGRWTAEMFLMFHLHRPDVLPVNDIGINRAIMRQYGLEAMPLADEVRQVGLAWHPWASVACWYLWRSEDVKPPEP
ncbi:MAG: DNA-3-methyladenine glycosylase 2 family protein [Anaerolineaceae bacterium]